MNQNNDELIKRLKKQLPECWHRPLTTKLTSGIVHSGTLANRMAQGDGPGGCYRIGRKVVITRDGFLEWLGKQAEPLKDEIEDLRA